ncbi:hypothetical protein MMC17_001853 [Xylographa soralifera]|nr:hypothetical protein [Xylographa soralifera]
MYFALPKPEAASPEQRAGEWDFIKGDINIDSQSSTSGSQSASSAASQAPANKLPLSVQTFFAAVSADGYPQRKGADAKVKAQPWKRVWQASQPSEDGKLLVACPKRCDFGSNGLGGY